MTEITVQPIDPTANCWCLDGAIAYCYRDQPKRIRDKVRAAVRRAIRQVTGKPYTIVEWNDEDGRTIAEIRRVVKLAGV